MGNKYLIRLDDACPTMDAAKWQRMEDILDAAGIRPMVGIIPHNEDPKQFIDKADNCFWNKALRWKNKGWAIALHGYNHCYISEQGMKGLNPLWPRSEFAGVPLEVQCEKINAGIAIMREHKLEPNYFFAPSHTFDKNTLIALKQNSNIRIISDTIATIPYKKDDFIFVPQLGGSCTKMRIPGIWTFCLHPSSMTDETFEKEKQFLQAHKSEFISFNDLDLENIASKNTISKIINWAYFMRRRLLNYKRK